MKCPKCKSSRLDGEWGDDNKGNSGTVYTCLDCGAVSSENDCIEAETSPKPKKPKVVHMQFYRPDDTFVMFSFCMLNTFSSKTSDVLFTTRWDRCTCKKCLKYKKDAGEPA